MNIAEQAAELTYDYKTHTFIAVFGPNIPIDEEAVVRYAQNATGMTVKNVLIYREQDLVFEYHI